MDNNGPIIVIEDDNGEKDVFTAALRETGYANEIAFYSDGRQALNYIRDGSPPPFLILCNVRTSQVDAFELKEIIQSDPSYRAKGVPFVLFATSASETVVLDAYNLSAQGFFIKPSDPEKLVKTLRTVIDYWRQQG